LAFAAFKGLPRIAARWDGDFSVGDTAADRRPALQPFNPFFEIALLEGVGCAAEGDPSQTDLLQN